MLLGWIAVLLSVATLHDAVPVNAEDAPPLRVCADPGNLPFSNDKGEGFENKLAELIAKDLGRELSYTWFTESTGYVPNTIGKDACDLVMGYAQGTGLIDDTNPYYYTSYVQYAWTMKARRHSSVRSSPGSAASVSWCIRRPPSILPCMAGSAT